MLVVEVGNADAIELQQQLDPQTGRPRDVFVRVEGERVTRIQLSDGMPPMAAVSQVVTLLQHQMDPTAKPWWFECQDEQLRTLLCSHYGISAGTTRPPRWGDGSTTKPPPADEGTPTKRSRSRGKDSA